MKGPIVFITGAAGGGIGTATALKFARNGYRIVITDIVDLRPTVTAIEALGLGTECMAIPMDVTNSESIATAVKRVLAEWRRVSVKPPRCHIR